MEALEVSIDALLRHAVYLGNVALTEPKESWMFEDYLRLHY